MISFAACHTGGAGREARFPLRLGGSDFGLFDDLFVFALLKSTTETRSDAKRQKLFRSLHAAIRTVGRP